MWVSFSVLPALPFLLMRGGALKGFQLSPRVEMWGRLGKETSEIESYFCLSWRQTCFNFSGPVGTQKDFLPLSPETLSKFPGCEDGSKRGCGLSLSCSQECSGEAVVQHYPSAKPSGAEIHRAPGNTVPPTRVLPESPTDSSMVVPAHGRWC
jgi:hypothetical protein